MTEAPGRKDWSVGFAVGALVGGVLAAILLALVGLGLAFYFKARPEHGARGGRPAAAAALPPAAPDAGDAEDDAEADDGTAEVLEVLVKLAGVTEQGEVRYVIDSEKQVVGETELIKALRELAAGDPKDPNDDLPVVVDLDVATAAGIKQAQVDAAVRACWAAGAAVLSPPDVSRETLK